MAPVEVEEHRTGGAREHKTEPSGAKPDQPKPTPLPEIGSPSGAPCARRRGDREVEVLTKASDPSALNAVHTIIVGDMEIGASTGSRVSASRNSRVPLVVPTASRDPSGE